MSKDIFSELSDLSTESRNSNSEFIDTASSLEIVNIINNEDKKCAIAVESQKASIAKAIDVITFQLKKGGRLLYLGAGTSGRLGVLDASECPPTFGTDPSLIQGIIAGGIDTLIRSKEGIEDQAEQGWIDLQAVNINSNDVLCGIMASGRTPYVVYAIDKAKSEQIPTIIIACNKIKYLKAKADINICLDADPEVVTGSTRMKSGTMQKMVLNMLSTGAMIRLGKVYKNVMVDVKMTSKKLEERAKKMVMDLCDLSYDESVILLEKASGHVKSAVAMHFTNLSYEKVQLEFEKSNNYLRPIINKESK